MNPTSNPQDFLDAIDELWNDWDGDEATLLEALCQRATEWLMRLEELKDDV